MKRRRSAERGRIPKALYVVCSTQSNPHANGALEVFTTRRKAERACRWGDQRLVVFVPQAPATPS
jgi:hypothetical protein